jgi:hypothetical protein
MNVQLVLLDGFPRFLVASVLRRIALFALQPALESLLERVAEQVFPITLASAVVSPPLFGSILFDLMTISCRRLQILPLSFSLLKRFRIDLDGLSGRIELQ